MKQHGAPITDYYTKLRSIWDELESSRTFDSCTTSDNCAFKKSVTAEQEQDRVYQFLMGLDHDVYATLITQILNSSALPTINRVFAMVTQEESHKAMVRSFETLADALGYATTNAPIDPSKPRVTCTHCGRPNHDVFRCYKLHGYPDQPFISRGRGRGRSTQGRPASISAHAIQSGASSDNGGPSKPLSVADFTPDMLQQLMSIAVSSKPSIEKLSGTPKHPWLLDSGASQHMTGTISFLSNIRTIPPCLVGLPNGARTIAVQCGDVRLTSMLLITNVLYVPSLTCNLISVSQLLRCNNCIVTFTNSTCFLQDLQTRRTIGQGVEYQGVYVLCQLASANAIQGSSSFALWHRRLGHPSRHYLTLLPFISSSNKIAPCDVCCRAKQTRSSFTINKKHSLHLFDLIHCDLWGPYRTVSSTGARYFLTILDDFSRHVWVYLLHDKHEACSTLIKFITMVQTQFNFMVKRVQTDNGTEFLSSSLRSFCDNRGILQQRSCAYTPQQNGRVERRHRHILNVARALRFDGHLPINLWGECILTATHLINRTPTPLLKGKCPYEVLYDTPPSYDHIHVLGCLCYATVLPKPSDKFAAR